MGRGRASAWHEDGHGQRCWDQLPVELVIQTLMDFWPELAYRSFMSSCVPMGPFEIFPPPFLCLPPAEQLFPADELEGAPFLKVSEAGGGTTQPVSLGSPRNFLGFRRLSKRFLTCYYCSEVALNCLFLIWLGASSRFLFCWLWTDGLEGFKCHRQITLIASLLISSTATGIPCTDLRRQAECSAFWPRGQNLSRNSFCLL